MKKISKLIASAITLAALGFAGCSNLSTDNSAYVYSAMKASHTVITKQGLKALKIGITSQEANLNFTDPVDSGAGRTILPGQIYASDFVYYLCTKKPSDTNFAVSKVQDNELSPEENGRTGTITREFELSEYQFQLYALPKGYAGAEDLTTIRTKAVLAAFGEADLRFHDSLSFYLVANTNAGAGKGTVSIHVANQEGWEIPKGWRVTAGIYSIDPDGENDVIAYPLPAAGATEIYAKDTDNVGTLGTYDSGTGAYTYNNVWGNGAASTAKLDQGNYNLIIKYEQTNASNEVINSKEYNERVVVLANQVSEKWIEIPQSIESAPNAPDCFIAVYKDASTKASASAGSYAVYFAWNGDLINNEKSFELDIMTLNNTEYYLTDKAATGAAAVIANGDLNSDAAWEAAESATGYSIKHYDRESFANAEERVSGSLYKNNTECGLKLKLGNRYYARIRAVNSGNVPSDWTYVYLVKKAELASHKYKCAVTAHATEKCANALESVFEDDTGYICFEDDVQLINRYRVTYDLNGGKFANVGTDDTPLPDVMFYESQHNKDNAGTIEAAASDTLVQILSPDAITPNVYWKTATGTTSRLDTADAAKITLKNDRIGPWKAWLLGSDEVTATNVYGTAAAAGAVRTWLTYALPAGRADLTDAGWTAVENYVTYIDASDADALDGATAAEFNPNVKYYGSSTGDAITQPANGTVYAAMYTNGGEYYLKQTRQPLYAGYSNLSLIAAYDGTKQISFEIQDPTVFEIRNHNVTLSLKNGAGAATQATYEGTDYWSEKTGDSVVLSTTIAAAKTATTYTLLATDITNGYYVNPNTECKEPVGPHVAGDVMTIDAVEKADGLDKANYIEVSQEQVTDLTFTVTKLFDITKIEFDPATNKTQSVTTTAADQETAGVVSSYNWVNLTITNGMSGASKVIKINQDNADEAFEWNVPISKWETGTYNVIFTCYSDEYPNSTFQYVATLAVTQ